MGASLILSPQIGDPPPHDRGDVFPSFLPLRRVHGCLSPGGLYAAPRPTSLFPRLCRTKEGMVIDRLQRSPPSFPRIATRPRLFMELKPAVYLPSSRTTRRGPTNGDRDAVIRFFFPPIFSQRQGIGIFFFSPSARTRIMEGRFIPFFSFDLSHLAFFLLFLLRFFFEHGSRIP